MNPTIPENKRELQQKLDRDREEWEAKGNRRTILPPSGQATDKTVNEGERYADR